MGHLQVLPDEIKLNIFSRLPDHNLAQLARTSKQLNNIITPLLWTDIEFHTQDYHNYQYIRQGPNYRSRACIPQAGCLGSRRAKVFFAMLQTLWAEDPVRFVHVAERVKHLCADVLAQCDWELPTTHDVYHIRVWELLPYFSNLESLGLRGDSYDNWDREDPVREIVGPTPQLRSVKLSGYIPRSLPVWILEAGNTLERLELAMLDRPLSSRWNPQAASIPLRHERCRPYDHSENSEAEYDDDDDSDDNGNNGNNDNFNYGDSEEESDWGSLNGDVIYPRPLGGYLYRGNELKLPKLKYLHLCQPAEAECNLHWPGYKWSRRAEIACYRDWEKLLKASVPTLSTLILDQRPAAFKAEDRDCDEEDWVPENTVMFASDTMMKMIHKVLETDQGPLEKVYLRGIAIPKDYGEPNLTESRARFLSEEPVVWFLDLLKHRRVIWKEETGRRCNFDENSGHAFWECDSEEMTIRGSASR